MNVEQRLVQAFQQADRLEPSADLFSRVLHSIDEDREHRSRVLRAVVGSISVVGILVLVGVLSLVDGDSGWFIQWQAMEAIETAALVTMVVVFGPGIRRFGRGFATDLFAATPSTAHSLLRLLDIAYALVCGGYIMLSTRFGTRGSGLLAAQLAETAERVGGLVMILGLLHGATLMVLPLVALVQNSTRTGRPLPRWIIGLLILLGVGVVLQLPPLVGLLIAGTS